MLRSTDKKLRIGEGLPAVLSRDVFLPLDDRGGGAISPFSGWSGGPGYTGALVGVNWPLANRALFVPFRVPIPVTIYKMVAGAGSVAGGNFDLGLYDAAGNRLVSSGTTARTASAENPVDITDTFLRPGLYYLAMAVDGTSQWAVIQPGLSACKLLGMRQMAAAFPLPATATFATVASSYLPWFCAYLRSE